MSSDQVIDPEAIDFEEAGPAAGLPVLFLHGIGGGAASFGPQLDALAATGRYRAIAWNMPGYGRTPPLGQAGFPGFAAAALALLDRLGIEAAALVGHSIGGMVAQQILADRPQRVRAAVLSATSPAFGKPDGAWQRAFIEARLGPLDAGHSMAELADGLVAELVGEDPDPDGVALARACMASVPEATYRQAMLCLVGFDQREALGRVAVPTLLIAGERDRNAPAPMMERMAERIPRARCAVIEGAGHLANLERPSVFNALLLEFLDTAVPA